MRLGPQAGERIDRGEEIGFFFEGSRMSGFGGDTIGSALYAAGQRVFSRSFKYHRPRGLLCCSGACPNCMMRVDGVPNVRVCVEPLREGARVEAQNVLGTLGFDLMGIVDKLGGRLLPAGFYYRTMIRPRRAWPLYERFLRHAAGLGKLDPHATRTGRFDAEHRRAEVLVVGGGEAGLEAARTAAAEGKQVVLVDEGSGLAGHLEKGIEILAPAFAIGIYEGGLVPVAAGGVLYRFRAERIVVATGAIEQPLVFPGNDRAGVMLPGAVRRLVRDFAVKPGERAVVVAADDRGLEIVEDLEAAGTEIARVVDLRRQEVVVMSARGRRGRLTSVDIAGRRTRCDLLVVSGGRQPAYSLLAQAGARVEYKASKGIFVPLDFPPNIEAVGSVTGQKCAGVGPSFSGRGG